MTAIITRGNTAVISAINVTKGVETITQYADGTLAGSADYTPAASGIFSIFSDGAPGGLIPQYYSTATSSWYFPENNVGTSIYSAQGIGDGTNFRVHNSLSSASNYNVFRSTISTATYTRIQDASLAASADYTPTTSGWIADGSVNGNVLTQVNSSTVAWTQAFASLATSIKIIPTDGTNVRIHNAATAAYQHVTMQARIPLT